MKFVWVDDGKKMYTRLMFEYELGDDGTVIIDGQPHFWFPVKL